MIHLLIEPKFISWTKTEQTKKQKRVYTTQRI